MLLELFHCSGGKTIIYTGSGTGAMSGIVESYVCTKRKAFVINGGDFGQRWYELCNYYGVPAVNYTVPFARDIDPPISVSALPMKSPMSCYASITKPPPASSLISKKSPESAGNTAYR